MEERTIASRLDARRYTVRYLYGTVVVAFARWRRGVSTACSLSSVLPKKESKDDELVVDDFQRSSTWSPDACL